MKVLILILVLVSAALAQQPAATPAEVAERFPSLRPVEIPEVASYTLANGMELYLLEDRTLPQISGAATIRAGNLFDPADKIGRAGIAGSVWRLGGTRSMTGEQIDEALEAMAASVETAIEETSGTVSFWTLTENFDSVLEIFADVLRHPEFRQDKLDLTLQQARGAIARRNDDAAGIASREFAISSTAAIRPTVGGSSTNISTRLHGRICSRFTAAMYSRPISSWRSTATFRAKR